jgi:hypothetical protein
VIGSLGLEALSSFIITTVKLLGQQFITIAIATDHRRITSMIHIPTCSYAEGAGRCASDRRLLPIQMVHKSCNRSYLVRKGEHIFMVEAGTTGGPEGDCMWYWCAQHHLGGDSSVCECRRSVDGIFGWSVSRIRCNLERGCGGRHLNITS